LTDTFRLEGVFTVLPTAFHDDGRLDMAGVAALVRAARDAGVAGFTALGVMGEAAELTEAERVEVLGCIADTAGSLPIVVGVTGARAADVEGRARDASRAGVAAVMVSPSRSLDLEHAVRAAEAADLPIVIQDYPPASGVTVTVEEVVSVAEAHPLVVGVKAEAPPTSVTIASLRRSSPRLGLAGGLGGLFLIDELGAGADGVMTGFALPERLVSIVGTYPTDPEGATEAFERLLPLMRLEAFPPYSLAARKEVWRLVGVIGSAYCRRAGAQLDDVAREDVRRALERVASWVSP
jgi:4-hydroxy-tetrahydrodipicolinate synthase